MFLGRFHPGARQLIAKVLLDDLLSPPTLGLNHQTTSGGSTRNYQQNIDL